MLFLDKQQVLNRILNADDTSYLTHNFHPYPAKFVPQVPRLLIEDFSQPSDLVLDPFCGSGTTLVEAKLSGRRAWGVDINPIGVLASKVKTTKLDETEFGLITFSLQRMNSHLEPFYRELSKGSDLSAWVGKSEKRGAELEYEVPVFHNRDHWFQPHVIQELAIMKSTLREIDNSSARDFLQLAFSFVVGQVSNQESDTRYAAVNKNITPGRAFNLFKTKVSDMIYRMKDFNKLASNMEVKVTLADTKAIDFVDSETVDLIVTSPPYPNTYDYYLYHKMRMFWLDLDWVTAKYKEIGSRLRHSSQRESIETFLLDMQHCFAQFHRVLKHGKLLVVVLGDSIIRQQKLSGETLVEELSKRTHFAVEDRLSYSLNLTSRLFNKAFRDPSKQEHIMVLRKV